MWSTIGQRRELNGATSVSSTFPHSLVTDGNGLADATQNAKKSSQNIGTRSPQKKCKLKINERRSSSPLIQVTCPGKYLKKAGPRSHLLWVIMFVLVWCSALFLWTLPSGLCFKLVGPKFSLQGVACLNKMNSATTFLFILLQLQVPIQLHILQNHTSPHSRK